MINYGTLETELVARLTAFFAAQVPSVADKFEAVPIPQNEAEQQRPFLKSRVTVQYYISTYAAAQSLNAVSQHETITMRLTFEAKNLRESNGFYALVNLVKKSLLGYKPEGCTKRLSIDKYDLVFYENNTVSPYLDLKTETVNSQAFDDSETGPPFVDVTIESQCPT